MKNQVHVIYYAEHTDDPKSWASPQPSFDLERFNKELERRGGTVGSVPRFRCKWAGNLDEYMLEEYDELKGYIYIVDGKEHFVSNTDLNFEFPDGATIAPHFEVCKVFTPRFVIEEYKQGMPYYEKAWACETRQIKDMEYGRIDVISHYREPSELDLQMAEHLSYLRDHLSDAEIAAGLAGIEVREQQEAAIKKEEFVDELAEETAKALTDGIPNAPAFNWKPKNTDIQKYSKRLIQEHDRRI